MTTRQIFFILFIAAGLALASGCTGPAHQDPGNSPLITANPALPVTGAPAGPVTPAGLTARVKEAVAFARQNGRDKAIAAFNDPAGRFSQGGISVFAEEYNGTALAEPFEQELVGTDVRNVTDRYGIPVVRRLAETAGYGIGYVSYDFPNPDVKNRVEPRLAVVANVDGTWYVGADTTAENRLVYPSSVLGPATHAYSVPGLQAFVKDAVRYAKENGKEKALAAFNNRSGQFADGELTIIAVDYNGTMIASSISPETAADRINLINYHDPDGVTTIREMRDLARQGGGISYTVAVVTRDNRTYYAPKIDYAEPVDDTYWLFSGVIIPEYEQLRDGNLTGITVRTHSRTELYDLVDRAVAYAKENGKEKTFAMVNDPAGEFVQGDLFVWAEDFNGTVLADPYWKEGIGRNYLSETDPYGARITQVSINAIKSGTGFTHVMFPDTTENSTAVIPKLVYMRPVDDTWWIGSGIYGVQAS